MLILLPPSETKRPGGNGASLRDRGFPGDSSGLSFSQQNAFRADLIGTLVGLADDPIEMARILKLGPKQLDEVAVNGNIPTSPSMPAIERFTGVLYDAIDVDSLTPRAREFISGRVLIQSALFGLIRASDDIPAYRLSFDSRVPGFAPLKKEWPSRSESILASHEGLILDLRSEGYAALAPVPERNNAFFVRAVGRTPDGTLRQLNHFNKKGKGVFVRTFASTYPNWVRIELDEPDTRVPVDAMSVGDVETLLLWAQTFGVELTRTDDPRVLQLVINEADYPPISARPKL